MFSMFTVILLILTTEIPCARTTEHRNTPLLNLTIDENTVITVPMQSVLLPCKTVRLHSEPEQVMWYKLTESGQSTLSVGKHLISKDSRLSVAHYSFDHGISPARWDLHIRHVHLSDAADYQCHCVSKNGAHSSRSTIKLIIQDILVDIEPNEKHLSTGEKALFVCSFTGKNRFQHENVTWFKDGQILTNNKSRVIKTIERNNTTMSTLEIIDSQSSDSGSYRCSDGHFALSREAKLYMTDIEKEIVSRSISSTSSPFLFCSSRTVFFLVVLTVLSLN